MARTIRDTYGETASTSVSTGRIIVLGTSQGWPPVGVRVTAGSQWNTVVENSAMSRMPITNSGSPARPSSTVWMIVSPRRRR